MSLRANAFRELVGLSEGGMHLGLCLSRFDQGQASTPRLSVDIIDAWTSFNCLICQGTRHAWNARLQCVTWRCLLESEGNSVIKDQENSASA